MLEDAVDMYFNKSMSIKQIAEVLHTYPNKLRRLFIKNGYTLRDKAESQLVALKTGRATHPTEGKQRKKSTKDKISKKVAAKWSAKSEDERLVFSAQAKDRWHKRDLSTQQEFGKKSALGVREAGKNGSKLEKYIMMELRKNEYEPQFHRENLVSSEKLQVDIFLPGDRVCIELDGPTHFLPIWGDEALEKKIERDNRKNGLLLQSGYHVLRVKCARKTLSRAYKEAVYNGIVWAIDKLEKESEAKLIYLEPLEKQNG